MFCFFLLQSGSPQIYLEGKASPASHAAFFAPQMKEVFCVLDSKNEDSTPPYCAALLVIIVN